jgi:LysM repeat protein
VQDDPATTQPPHADRPFDGAAALDTSSSARRQPVDEPARDPRICPFLRSRDGGDRLDAPVDMPDQANRCAALHDPVPQSLRQQELVCLTSGHVNCPRYLRGAMTTATPVARVPKPRIVTPAIAGSALALIGAFLLSVAFVVANGGLVLTAAVSSPSGAVLGEVDTASPSPGALATTPATAEPTAIATPSPSPTPTTSPAPTPSPTASPTPTPDATPLATPKATPKPTAKSSSSRYALLKPCADKTGCYVYVIRSGDNLYSIVNYFGVSLKTVKAWNPWTSNGLKVGRGLRIPPPTR